MLLSASHARRALPGRPVAEAVVACVASHTDSVAGKAPLAALRAPMWEMGEGAFVKDRNGPIGNS